MEYIFSGFKEAVLIIFSLNPEFLYIVWTSIKVSILALLLAVIVGVPVGIFVGLVKFRGRDFVAVVLNTLMSMPTVVIGLLVYAMISRRGPLGGVGLLYTVTAMVIGQAILAFPIVAALVVAAVRNHEDKALRLARVLGASPFDAYLTYISEARFSIFAAVIAGFGRVFSEIGISMMLGGNIRFYTRNITTAIALETAKGRFGIGIALGMVLLAVAFILNTGFHCFQKRSV
ncbi:MAG: ABC transporter permease [Candidatus Omnitrophica bacterium]|nr:ABC transporter permease [Candidatus Omnitrophota bacterium]MBU1127816.1 ABC transporter permease [Candidatus Omnitrophota bacterium]MBU1784552.1 ABC transporter permease [Candidatus Omnitrophota bacterium]MBU1851144.1 ABC transporter permease [Candidatus Omnitrophota bacterium]